MSCQVMGIGSRGSTFPGEAKEERESDHRLLLAWPRKKWTILIVYCLGTKIGWIFHHRPPGSSSGHKKRPRRRWSSFESVCKSLFSANTSSCPSAARDGVEVVPIWKKRPDQYLTIKWPSFLFFLMLALLSLADEINIEMDFFGPGHTFIRHESSSLSCSSLLLRSNRPPPLHNPYPLPYLNNTWAWASVNMPLRNVLRKDCLWRIIIMGRPNRRIRPKNIKILPISIKFIINYLVVWVTQMIRWVHQNIG